MSLESNEDKMFAQSKTKAIRNSELFVENKKKQKTPDVASGSQKQPVAVP